VQTLKICRVFLSHIVVFLKIPKPKPLVLTKSINNSKPLNSFLGMFIAKSFRSSWYPFCNRGQGFGGGVQNPAAKISAFFNKLYLIRKLSLVSPNRRNSRKELLRFEPSTSRRGAFRFVSSTAIQLIGFMTHRLTILPVKCFNPISLDVHWVLVKFLTITVV